MLAAMEERLPTPWNARAIWPLAVVVAFELFLFADYFHERRVKSLLPRDDPQALAGEGLLIRSDGLGYYAWLRSLLLDGDWQFDNEFDEHNALGDWLPEELTATGRRANPWSVGPACVWALPVAAGHLFVRGNGYELPYQLLVGVTTLLASFVGLGFIYKVCRQYAAPQPAALAAALLTLGTSLVYYNVVEGAMAHGIGSAAVAGLVWYWQRTYGAAQPGRWLMVGVLLGFVAAVRWQLATLAVLPIVEVLFSDASEKRFAPTLLRSVAKLLLAALGAMLGFAPQLLAWRVVYGDWFVAPMPVAHNWLTPAFGQVLLSPNRGLFYWTPLALLACAGFALPRGVCSRSSLILAAAFVLQVYALASVSGQGVYLGVAFGMRQLTESLVLLAPGLALLLGHVSPRGYRLLAGLGCLLVLWNLLLLSQFRYGYLPADAGADVGTMLSNAGRLVARKRWLLVGQVALAPLLLAWALSRKRLGIPLHRGKMKREISKQTQPRAALPIGALRTEHG